MQLEATGMWSLPAMVSASHSDRRRISPRLLHGVSCTHTQTPVRVHESRTLITHPSVLDPSAPPLCSTPGELSQLNPAAKVVLTVRNATEWARSVQRTVWGPMGETSLWRALVPPELHAFRRAYRRRFFRDHVSAFFHAPSCLPLAHASYPHASPPASCLTPLSTLLSLCCGTTHRPLRPSGWRREEPRDI